MNNDEIPETFHELFLKCGEFEFIAENFQSWSSKVGIKRIRKCSMSLNERQFTSYQNILVRQGVGRPLLEPQSIITITQVSPSGRHPIVLAEISDRLPVDGRVAAFMPERLSDQKHWCGGIVNWCGGIVK